MQRSFTVAESAIAGHGLFADKPFAPGETLLSYTGPRSRSTDDALPRIHWFELRPNEWIDGSNPDNLAAFANHSCNPNTEVILIEDALWLVARRAIATGDEITFDYGLTAADALSHPCDCGASQCRGFIVAAAEFPKLLSLRRSLQRRRH